MAHAGQATGREQQRKTATQDRNPRMEEKDRYGEKLREKGKGDEDRYFAEQERKRIERYKLAASVGSGGCPRDGSKLVAHKADGVTVEICPSCRGMWLDQGEMSIVVKQKNETAVIHWIRSLFGH